MQQAHDPITSELLAYGKKAQRPRQERLEGKLQNLRSYWSRFDELTVENGILCLRTPVGEEPETMLRSIVPRAEWQEILELAHRSRVGVTSVYKRQSRR